MMETTIALGILLLVSVAILGGSRTTLDIMRRFSINSTSENIARNQMEYVFSQPYQPPPGTYATITPPYSFTVTAEALVYDATNPNIETVRVTVFHQSLQSRVLETLRSNR
jgi:hypothetical protein